MSPPPDASVVERWKGFEVGVEFALGQPLKITQEMLHHYAWASNDYNPIHNNIEAAQAMGLPGVIAHGMFSLGLMNKEVEALAARAGRDNQVRIEVASMDTRFVGMTLVGDTLSMHAKVQSIKESEMTVQLFVFKNGDRQALTCSGSSLLRRKG